MFSIHHKKLIAFNLKVCWKSSLEQLYLQVLMRNTLGMLRMNEIKVYILLAITSWVAHFWHYRSFGLYEDDLYRITRVMGASWPKVWEIILEGGGQGRPLHDGMIYALSFLGLKLGGLHSIYLIAWVIVTANSYLFYVLLKRLSGHQVVAVTGALAFCLFPADTTKAFLTHSLGIQPSLMLFLIALHCYLSSKRSASYLLILGSLLCYETIYPVFLAAPLLKNRWEPRLKGEMAKHALVLGVMLVGVVIIRKLTIGGVGVTNDLSVLSAIRLSSYHMLIGPIVSITMFVNRPIKTLLELNREQLQILPIYLVALIWMLSNLKLNNSTDIYRLTTSFKTRVFRLEIPEFLKDLAMLALKGLIMLVLAYPLTLTVSATEFSGRASRVHMAAMPGGSILCACICSAILFIASAYRKQRVATLGIAALFSLLLGFGLTVQKDYRISWQYQRAFWTDVINLCPDITDGTMILVESANLKNPRQIEAHSWSTPVVLNSIYHFPESWKSVPRVYKLKLNWQQEAVLGRNLFQLSKATTNWLAWLNPKPNDTIESSNIILLQTKNGQLTRRTKPLEIAGQRISLKEKSALKPSEFKKGPLYDYIIMNSDEKPIDYLTK